VAAQSEWRRKASGGAKRVAAQSKWRRKRVEQPLNKQTTNKQSKSKSKQRGPVNIVFERSLAYCLRTIFFYVIICTRLLFS
jgi:hypothetical protein